MRSDDTPAIRPPADPQWAALTVFVAGVVIAGSLIGLANVPGDWYAGLDKPSFNPPNWIFAPVWTVLYVIIAIAGWRTWRRNREGATMFIWWAQLALNFAWSPVFFGLHQIGAALAVIVALLAAILVFIAVSWKSDRIAALLFVPYAAWVCFATLLTASIYALNG